MDENIEEVNEEEWDGVEKREIRRRYIIDRRSVERRKRYIWSVILPICLGAGLSALVSWGVYVTHITYRISANYEETFVKHIESQVEESAAMDHRLEVMKTEYTTGMHTLRQEMTSGLKEIRDMQAAMYRILLENERRKKTSEEPAAK